MQPSAQKYSLFVFVASSSFVFIALHREFKHLVYVNICKTCISYEMNDKLNEWIKWMINFKWMYVVTERASVFNFVRSSR